MSEPWEFFQSVVDISAAVHWATDPSRWTQLEILGHGASYEVRKLSEDLVLKRCDTKDPVFVRNHRDMLSRLGRSMPIAGIAPFQVLPGDELGVVLVQLKVNVQLRDPPLELQTCLNRPSELTLEEGIQWGLWRAIPLLYDLSHLRFSN